MKRLGLFLGSLCFCLQLQAQQKVLMFGSGHFNDKNVPLYQEKIEQRGGSLLAYEKLTNGDGYLFVKVDASKEQSVIDIMLHNEMGNPVSLKLIPTSDQLAQLGIQNPLVYRALYQEQTQKHKEDCKHKEVNIQEKEGLRKEDLPFTYEKTGDPLIDQQNYDRAKAQWIQQNPKEYQLYIENPSLYWEYKRKQSANE